MTAETLQQIANRNRDSSLILATVDEYARKHDIDRPEHPTAESKHLALDNLLRHVAADIRSGNAPENEFDYVGDSDYTAAFWTAWGESVMQNRVVLHEICARRSG